MRKAKLREMTAQGHIRGTAEIQREMYSQSHALTFPAGRKVGVPRPHQSSAPASHRPHEGCRPRLAGGAVSCPRHSPSFGDCQQPVGSRAHPTPCLPDQCRRYKSDTNPGTMHHHRFAGSTEAILASKPCHLPGARREAATGWQSGGASLAQLTWLSPQPCPVNRHPGPPTSRAWSSPRGHTGLG